MSRSCWNRTVAVVLTGPPVSAIKIEGRLVRHARRLVFQLAEVAVPREVFRQVLERIGGLHSAPGYRVSLGSSEVTRIAQGELCVWMS